MHRRPPATGLTTAMWRFIPPILIPVDAVVSTQAIYGQLITEHIAGPAKGEDPYAHVVVVGGRWLIEDGHHRHRAAVLAGEALFPARVFTLHPEQIPTDWCCPLSACVQEDDRP